LKGSDTNLKNQGAENIGFSVYLVRPFGLTGFKERRQKMGRRIKSAGVVILGVVVISLVFGVSQALATDLATLVKEAEERYAKFEKEVQDMTMVHETVTTEPKMTSEMKTFKKGKKFRLELKTQMPEVADMPEGMGMAEMEFIVIYDGKDTWMISPFTGKEKLSDGEKQYQTEENWWDWLEGAGKVVGSEQVDGRDCYVVEVEEKEEFPFTRLWLDKKNLTMVKGESKETTGEKMVFVNSDFRRIKGDWEIPCKTEVYMNGRLISTSVVKSLEINKGLSDDLFDPDKVEVKTPDMQEMMRRMMQEE